METYYVSCMKNTKIKVLELINKIHYCYRIVLFVPKKFVKNKELHFFNNISNQFKMNKIINKFL